MWKLPIDVTQTMLHKQTLIEGNGLPSLWQDGRYVSSFLKDKKSKLLIHRIFYSNNSIQLKFKYF